MSAALPAPGERPGFTVEPAYLVSFNAPPEAIERVMRAVLAVDPLHYGAYDQVAFRSAPGIEQFRTLPGSRAGASERRSDSRSQRITFALPPDPERLGRVLDAIHHAHPFEEPVIHVERGWVTRARAGHDPSNPNRWWNLPAKQAPAAGR